MIWLLCAITFLAAFLLFQIELIIAKLFLPAYGGSYLVWGACVVFFQAILLAGYVFAHRLIEHKGTGAYLKIHAVLLLLPFLFFPGTAIQIQNHAGTLPLVLDIFMRLLTTIGPVFFVLSTVSLVTQTWLAGSHLPGRAHPYVLYAVSNTGSFAALWTYPFIVEYFLTNTQQLNVWRGSYVVLVLLNMIALKLLPIKQQHRDKPQQPITLGRGIVLRWLLLSTASVVMFLSITNMITYEVAPIPLLWIIPLSIYLLTFVLTFKPNPWYPRWMGPLPVVMMAAGMLLYFQVKLAFLPAAWAIIIFNLALFVLCLYAQHELIKNKPGPGGLTLFYVMISLGGFLGGFITSWIVPLISHSPVEFLWGLALMGAAYPKKWVRRVLAALAAAALIADGFAGPHKSLVKKRNYYGIYDVFDTPSGVRTFVHGTTLHGIQWADPARRFIPLGYYSPLSPMGEIFRNDIFAAKRVGAVGLGAGTIAMYGKGDMAIDFYELDPDVVDIAQKYFWYLGLAPGPLRVAVGDARISLAQAGNVVYDILLIDAFGGDSVPFHLINKDVVKLYRQRLTAGGGILFHIPNRYFDLGPVLANIARDLGAYAAVKEAKQDGITLRTFWAVLTWDQEKFVRLITREGWRPLAPEQFKFMRTWSDDFSTVLPIIRLDELWGSLKYFKWF
ncbi:MAG: fused MFS/spermidine synthase [Candidatus Omnitrophica bacterium]|nr:fused MFS/spermidine synthase [Candidatus Omnitrophota bacterium]